MNTLPHSGPVSRSVLDTAIDWRLRLDAGEASIEAFQKWLQAHPDHARVWQQFHALDQRLGKVGRIGRAALLKPRPVGLRAAGRAMLVVALVLSCLIPVANRQWPLRYALSDQLTGTAERREVMLDDRTRVQLDARTAVNVAFDAGRRRLILRTGEILVETAHGDSRPFVVSTADGDLRALGTRFLVHHDDEHGTRLVVLQSAVAVTGAGGEEKIVRAGESLWIRQGQLSDVRPAPVGADAWIRGMLAVENARLEDVIATLSRHSLRGITLDPQAADWRVTGSFPLNDLDTALAALGVTLPIQQERLGSWWVRLTPRQQEDKAQK